MVVGTARRIPAIQASHLLAEALELLAISATNQVARLPNVGNARRILPRDRFRSDTSCQCSLGSSIQLTASRRLTQPILSLRLRKSPSAYRTYSSAAAAQIVREADDEWFSAGPQSYGLSRHPFGNSHSVQFGKWPLPEGSRHEAKSDRRVPESSREASSIHDLYSHEVYGEGGLVEQANYFVTNKAEQDSLSPQDFSSESFSAIGDNDSSGQNIAPELLTSSGTLIGTEVSLSATPAMIKVQPSPEFTALVHSLGSDTSQESSMQQRLDSIQRRYRSVLALQDKRKRSSSSNDFGILISTLLEGGAELKTWRQLVNHLKVAIRRWRKSKMLAGTASQVSLCVAYAHAHDLRKAVFLASELIRSTPSESCSSKMMQLCADLTQRCLEINDHDLVLEMWAANAEPFTMSLGRPMGDPEQPHDVLRKSLETYCASINHPEALVKQRYDKERGDVGQDPLRERRMERIVQVLLTASSATNAKQAGRIYHAFTNLSVCIPPSIAALVWTELAAAGDHAEAWRVFSESSLGGLIRGRLQHRNTHETLSRVVHLAQECGNLQTARSAFRQIALDGFAPTARDSELLLRACADIAQTSVLEELVQEFFPQDFHLLETEISGPQEAPLAGKVSSQRRRRAITQAFIRTHVLAEDVNAARTWWRRLEAQLDGPYIRDYNMILQLYARQGNLIECQRLFDDMSRRGIEPDAASFTSILATYATKRDYIAAGQTIADMQKRGIVVDPIAIGSMLNVAIETGNWQGVAKIYESLDVPMRSDLAIAGTMMKALMLLGAPYDEIKKLFLKSFTDTSRASQRAWSIIIQSACDAGRIDEAQEFLLMSTRNKQSLSQPNSYAFTILVAYYLRKGDIANAKRVFSRMDQSGVPLTSVAYSLVIRSLLKDNSVDKDSVHRFAEELLIDRPWQQVDSRGRGCDTENIITPVMIEASRLGNTAQVEQYMQRLAEQDLVPSITISTIMMDAYRRARQLDKMRMVWNHIFRNACQMRQTRDQNGPSNILCIPLSIFLDGLTTACHHEEAFETWRSVAENGFGFDAQNWNHLAVALMRSGQPERAFDIVENVLLKKAEQVKSRSSPFMRETVSIEDEIRRWQEKEISSEVFLEGDLQDEAAMRPPNRRHQYRRGMGTFEQSGDVTSRLLQSWRPADITWRPTFLTIAVLERAYTQLENGVPVMALLAGQEEDVDEGSPNPHESPSSDAADTGRRSSSPIVLLARLNRRYARTVSLIMLHRRKRTSRQARKSKKTEVTKIRKAEVNLSV